MPASRFSRRSLAAGLAALAGAAPPGPSWIGEAVAAEEPFGHLVAVPLDEATGERVAGLVVLDMASMSETVIDVPPIDTLIRLAGSSYALARARDLTDGETLVVDAAAGVATPLTALTPGDDLGVVAAWLFNGYKGEPFRAESGRWLLPDNEGYPRYLFDLQRATVVNLATELEIFGGTAASLTFGQMIPDSDSFIVEANGQLLVVHAATLDTIARVAASNIFVTISVSPGGTRVSWATRELDGIAEIDIRRYADLPGASDGASTVILAVGGDPPTSFAWLDDDTALITSSPFGTQVNPSETTFSVFDLVAESARPVATVDGSSGWPVVAAGGERALTAAFRDDALHWSLLDLVAGELRELPDLANAGPLFAIERESRVVLMTGDMQTAGGAIRRFDIPSGSVTPLLETAGALGYRAPLVAPGGGTVAMDVTVYDGTSTPGRCLIFDLASGRLTTIEEAAVAGFAPDGRHLLTWQVNSATHARPTLQLRDLGGVILQELGQFSQITWVG